MSLPEGRDIIDQATEEDTLTFRHIQPEDGDDVTIPDEIHHNNIHFEVDADGNAHLMWIEGDNTRVP